jgi:hypothetical protein
MRRLSRTSLWGHRPRSRRSREVSFIFSKMIFCMKQLIQILQAAMFSLGSSYEEMGATTDYQFSGRSQQGGCMLGWLGAPYSGRHRDRYHVPGAHSWSHWALKYYADHDSFQDAIVKMFWVSTLAQFPCFVEQIKLFLLCKNIFVCRRVLIETQPAWCSTTPLLAVMKRQFHMPTC